MRTNALKMKHSLYPSSPRQWTTLSVRTKISADTMDFFSVLEQKHIVIFGDFNLIPTAPAFEALSERDYSYVIRENTNISLKTPQGSTCMDNIWLSAPAKALTKGK